MEQGSGEDNIDGPAQGPLFKLEHDSEDGCAWICSKEGRDVWCRNLGPISAACTVMANFLGEVDFGDMVPDLG
jgi:hypothetical protein